MTIGVATRALGLALMLASLSSCGGEVSPPTSRLAPSAAAVPEPDPASTKPPPEPAPKVAPEDDPPGGSACPSSLPTDPPPDLVIGVSRTSIPRGKAPVRSSTELAVRGTDCEACVWIDAATLEPLWRSFIDLNFIAFRTNAVRRSPHVGSRFLWLRWDDSKCEVGDTSRHALDGNQEAAFDQLLDQVSTAAKSGVRPH